MPTRIALIQQAASSDTHHNLQQGLLAARRAIDQGSQIVCFAELAFSKFFPRVPGNRDQVDAETIPGPTTIAFSKLAKETKAVFVLNLYEQDGSRRYDASPVIDADGALLGTTRMVHITDYDCFHEQDYYDPGDRGAPVYETRYGRLGVAICYDRHYPEYMRALGVAGAEIVCVPQAGVLDEWPAGLYQAELQVAAFQNGYYTALCNRVGSEGQLHFAGESFVCRPDGGILASAASSQDEILVCDLDLTAVGSSHARQLFFRDRRPQLYGAWLS